MPLIKHYPSKSHRKQTIIRVADITALDVRPNRHDVDYVIVDIYMKSGFQIYITLTDAELEGLIGDVKVGDDPQHEITNMDDFVYKSGSPAMIKAEPCNPDNVKGQWSCELDCFVDINGNPVL